MDKNIKETKSIVQEWISVKDKLPKISDYDNTFWVLVCDKEGYIYTAQYMQTEIEPDEEDLPVWYQFGRDSYKALDILYWMELPELPIKK